MNKRQIILDFTSLLDVIMILICQIKLAKKSKK